MEITDAQNNVLKKDTGGTVGEILFNDKYGTTENVQVGTSQNIPLALSGQCGSRFYNKWKRQRRYTKAKQIETLAINKYKQNGRGIGFKDLLSNDLATHKQQAQITLKHCRRAKILFTPYNRKPQQYYPTCLKSEILNKNIPIRATGVGLSKPTLVSGNGLRKWSYSSSSNDCRAG
jgi:hypothetical protein